MTSLVLRMEQPSALGRLGRIAWLCAGIVYVAMAVTVSANAAVPMVELPWVAVAHAVALAILTGITALLLYAHSVSASARGYLALAVVFGTVFMLQLAVPLVFPGVFVEGPLLGDEESSITLFYLWNAVFFVGVPVAAVVLATDERRAVTHPVSGRAALGCIIVPGLVVDVWVIGFPGLAPRLTTGTGVTALAESLDWVLLGLAVTGLAVVVLATRGAAMIGRWLIAVAVLGVGAALVNVHAERFSLGWYFNRTVGLFMMSLLLVALVLEHVRVSRVAYDIASQDVLTGATSRAVFQLELDRVVRRAVGSGEALSLLWIDLDRFKAVNDRLGHPAGDAVLAEAARRIAGEIRDGDLVARMGGDEFACLLTRVRSAESAHVVASRIAEQLRSPVAWGAHSIECSCSVGISFLPGDAQNAEDLLAHADRAMYAAKRAGGSRVEQYGIDLTHTVDLVDPACAETSGADATDVVDLVDRTRAEESR